MCKALHAQKVLAAYSAEYPSLSFIGIVDSNVLLLNPLPFDMVYLVELDKEVFVNRILIDRSLESVEVYAFSSGEWLLLNKSNSQTVVVNRLVEYFLIKFHKDRHKTYILIE